MTRRKLIYFQIISRNKNYFVTLFKDKTNYIVRTEYEYCGDKIKETNQEINLDTVYRIYRGIEKIEFGNQNYHQEIIGELKVYYGEYEYLESKINKRILDNMLSLKDVVMCLVEYIDESLNKKMLI